VAYEAEVLAGELKLQKLDRMLYPSLARAQLEPGPAVVVRTLLASGMLCKLSGYQHRIEGSLFRSMQALERLQTSRPEPKPAKPADSADPADPAGV
jgi:hypothetical protein